MSAYGLYVAKDQRRPEVAHLEGGKLCDHFDSRSQTRDATSDESFLRLCQHCIWRANKALDAVGVPA